MSASELHNHCRHGDVGLLESYLHDTVMTSTANQTDEETGYAAIHEAAIAGHADVIYLLKNEMADLDVNITTDEGPASTPLHLAAQKDNANVVIALVECGAILNSVDRCWRTPLDVAFQYDSQTVINVITMFEITRAAQSENIPLLDKLLVKVTSYQQLLPESLLEWKQKLLNITLINAAKRGNRHVVAKLVSYGANNFQECIESTHQNNHISAFLYVCQAILNNDLEVIDILLARKDEMVEHLPRYQELMKYRIILSPLLQNGKMSLSTPIKVALSAGKLTVAGQILHHVSHHPSCGIIDWHDLELNYIDPHWLQGHGINSLTYIGLSSNRLRVIPEQIVRFNNLQKLQVHHNRITCIPGDLFSLPRITHIDVSFNLIVALPSVLRESISGTLETLNLANNKLQALPEYLKHSRIQLLDISSNWFNTVPNCLTQMKHLHTLNLTANIGIEVVPYRLGNLRHLSFLGLEGLPYIKNIPSKEKLSPLSFLRSRARTLQIITHYDVSVVGTDEPYYPCLDTVFNAIEQQSKRRHFSCLKFTNTRQFLHFQQTMSLSCTLYVLVWDCQSHQSANELLHHILHLVLYSPNAVVIVAACWVVPITPTQDKWVEDQLKRSSWKRFRDHVMILTVSLDESIPVKQANSLHCLLDTISSKGSEQRSRHTVPNSYFVLLDYISKEATRLLDDGKPPLASSWDIWELIRSSPHHDLASYKELSLVLSFLTSVASLLTLPSNQTDERDYYVLNRQWFLNAMSGLLLQHQNVDVSSGLFPLASVCDLLSCPSLQADVPSPIYSFVSRIALAIPVASRNVLISTMLPHHNTVSLSDFSSQYQVGRVYTFMSTPASFWPQLISHLLVIMSQFISLVSRDEAGEMVNGCSPLPDVRPRDVTNWHYWRDGMIVWLYGSQLVYSVEAINPIVCPEYKEGIQIRVSNTQIGLRALNIMTISINSLLKNWYPQLWNTVDVKASCPHCNSTLVSIKDCCRLTIDKSHLTCQHDQRELDANDLIPDLSNDDVTFVSMNDLDVNIHDQSSCLNRPPLATVFRGEYTQLPVAVKPFPPLNGYHKVTPFLDYWHELTILNHIRLGGQSPYLIELLMSTIDPLALVFTCAPFCSLEEVILEASIKLLPLLRVRIVYQLASALETLHSLKVIHRNVCLDNILVYSLSLDDQVNIKLGGYSSSCLELRQGLANGDIGTFPAPEMSIESYEYDQRVDVFSFAFTSYEIITRKKLKCRTGVRFETASGSSERPHLKPVSELSPYFTMLLEKCWNSAPYKRPFFTEIVKHFQNPIHNLTREGLCINELHEYNAATVRYNSQPNGSFTCDLYICSSILCVKDSTILSHLSVPGLSIKDTTSLPSQYIICMACTTDYLWVSFQHQYVRIYSSTSLEFIKEIRFDCHVLVMAVSPNSIYLGKEDGELQVYNLSQPSPLHCPTKTQVIYYQQPIKALQVLDDSVICCTNKSFARLHPVTLSSIQKFPTESESFVKCAVMAVDRSNSTEFLWVGFRRLQQLVVFNGITGQPIYGINCCDILYMERSEVWVTCLQVVLDTIWVGLNTGYILFFNAYSPTPILLSYVKAHTESVRQLLLLQPSYWECNSYSETESSNDSSQEEDDICYSSLPTDSIPMPRVVSVISCGQGIEKKIPRVGIDGVVLTTSTEDVNGLQMLKFDAPDVTGTKKLECQSHRSLRPYMVGYTEPIYTSLSISVPPSLGHRSIPNCPAPLTPHGSGVYDSIQPNPNLDPDLDDFVCVSLSEFEASQTTSAPPPPPPPPPHRHDNPPPRESLSSPPLCDSDDGGSGYEEMRGFSILGRPPATYKPVDKLQSSGSVSSNPSIPASSFGPEKKK